MEFLGIKRCLCLIVSLFFILLFSSENTNAQTKDLMEMSLEEILNLTVDTSASFTKVKTSQQPVASTVITSEMIKNSGARRIDDLLEIFVPSLQFIRHNYGQNHVGIRGILADKDNKMRFLVNGKDMTEKTQNGFLTERDLPMLSDIEKIEIVRGPVASVYGPGTIGGVVSITTFSGKTFQGTEAVVKAGFFENFSSAEIKHGTQLSENHNLLVYYGLTNYVGADSNSAPLVSGDNVTRERINVEAGGVVNPDVNKVLNDRAAYNNEFKHKLMVRWNYKDLDTWMRYTKGGEMTESRRGSATAPNYNEYNSAFAEDNVDIGYSQFSLSSSYKHSLIDGLLSDSHQLTFDETEWARHELRKDTGIPNLKAYRENKINYKNIFNLNLFENHNAALGFDLNSGFYGLRSRILNGQKDGENFDAEDISNGKGWNLFTYGLFAEYNGAIIPNRFSTLLGFRVDKHPYVTDLLFSSRGALIFNITSSDVVKFIVNGSQRAADENILRKAHNAGASPDIEKNVTYELMYDKYVNKELSLHGGFYINDAQLIAWNSSAPNQGTGALGASQRIGDFLSYGFEFEGKYVKGKNRYSLSHTYLKLHNFDMAEGASGQDFAMSPYGYGDYLTIWANNETKFSFHKQQTEKFGFDSSLVVYWSYPGAIAWADYNRDTAGAESAMSSDYGYRDMGKTTAFLNLGADYSFTEAAYLRLDLYNVLGWADKNLNKRMYIKRTSEYRSSAPAVAVTAMYKF